MMNQAINYLKQFEELVTDLRIKYTSDIFFRTTVHVIGVQAAFVLICILAFTLALRFTEQQEIILASTIVAAILSGLVLTRFTLKPARDSLADQKRFISNVAHELRTPISTIKTSTEVALLDSSIPGPIHKVLTEILVELERASGIMNNLLSLSTLARPERMSFQNVDLGPIVNTAVKLHTPFARERDIKMIVKKDAERVVWGNAVALQQVVTNVLKNAISYTPKRGQGTVTVMVRPDYHGMIVLSIADNGIGIAQDDLFHIMEPFYRADTSRVRRIKKSGSGLGLAIVYEIVRAHHGRIHIQSAKGKGTTVSIFLPAGNAPSTAGQSETSIDFSKGGEVPLPANASA